MGNAVIRTAGFERGVRHEAGASPSPRKRLQRGPGTPHPAWGALLAWAALALCAGGCAGIDDTGTHAEASSATPGLGRYRALAAGAYHGCELGRSGIVSCQGSNRYGQLGDGTTTSRATPVAVGGLGNQVSITAGLMHSCSIGADGRMRCWGGNDAGQLGTGTTTGSTTPQVVYASFFSIAPLAGVVTAAAGYMHTCAVDSRGFVWCWGLNHAGQLGDGTSSSHSYATPVLLGAVGVAAGVAHTCALLADRTVRCWGENTWGQLGDGSTSSRATPAAVPGLSGVVALEASYYGTCALLANSTVRCWGYNGTGEAGNGTAVAFQSSPVAVRNATNSDELRNVRSIAAGASHNCAALTSGQSWCWGANQRGQLGDGTATSPRRLPVLVSGLGAGRVVHVVGGAEHTCAKLADGNLWCWGGNDDGQFGDNTTLSSTAPRRSLVPQWISSGGRLAVGDRHVCVLAADRGRVWCWGWNDNGQLGDGTWTDRLGPTVVPNLNDVVQIGAGARTTCALVGTGDVLCWGFNGQGQVGNPSAGYDTYSPTPVVVVSNATAITLGDSHGCALLGDGTARCWGANTRGQLGDGTVVNRPTAVPVGGLSNVVALSAGGAHTCALIDDGTLRCWGSNTSGQLGDGTVISRPNPGAVSGITHATAVSAGYGFTCARLDDGTLRCWGANGDGQLGDDSTVSSSYPVVPSGLSNAIGLTAGAYHTCALLDDGTVRCWGWNDSGQIGTDAVGWSSHPYPVTGLDAALEVAAGAWTTCALRANGSVWCWGNNDHGELGNGTRDYLPHRLPAQSWAQP
jgi:alpha-tubulin suppressor-like RCC1 family protein